MFFVIKPELNTFFHLLGYAIPAVNCVSSSGINACLEAARNSNAPVIVQFSSGGSQVRTERAKRVSDRLRNGVTMEGV